MGKKFRFIHTADTHLGHSGNASRYNEFKSLRIQKKNESEINIRQADIDDAFSQVMDLAIEHKVDAVLNAGDSWDFWGYKQPHVENVYTREVSRLFPQGIKYIEIVGNHDYPKQKGKGCHLETIGYFPGVHTAYGYNEKHDSFYHTIELDEHNVVIHCMPSTPNQEVMNEALQKITPVENKINIGMGHFGVTTIKHYAENAENALVVDLDTLIKCNMDYFALGDYHTPTDFGHNIRYSGSTERMGFGEIDNKPQVLLVEIDFDSKEVFVKPLYLNVRPMIDLPVLDAKGMPIEQVNLKIAETLNSTDLTDKIVRFRVKNLSSHLKRLIDDNQINELTKQALYFKLEFPDKINKSIESKTAGTNYEGVLEGWNNFMATVEDDGTFDKERLRLMGYEKLAIASENSNGQ